MDEIPVHQVLAVCADFDRFGPSSMELIAWEMLVPERDLACAWSQAVANGWLQRAGRDGQGERLWKLTAAGLAASQKAMAGP